VTNLDDQPLQRTPGIAGGPDPPPSPRPPAALIIGTVLLLAAAGFLAHWWWRDRPAPDAAPTAAAPPPPAPIDGGALPEPDVAPVELPPLDDMDPFLRGLLGALSARPELARWLATDDLIRHLAVAIDRVARGVSPAGEFGTIAPSDPYATATRLRRYFTDPAGYRRYDGIVATVGGMDMTAVARIYRAIHPRLNEAYRGLGRTGDVDRAVSEGLILLLETPVPPESPELTFGDGPNFVYLDPALEGLLPAQKQLVRMGPDHVRTLTRKLEELQAALAPSAPPR
jgi:hypothetical protein